jgi:glycosyltransferase involved in cell wall biosynthesis
MTVLATLSASVPRLPLHLRHILPSRSPFPDIQMVRRLLETFMLGETTSPSNIDPLVNIDLLAHSKKTAQRIALIGGFTPRRCGITTFTADIYSSITASYPDFAVDVYAMAPVANDIVFASPVRGVIVESVSDIFIAAADAIEASRADIVWLQHEFGLFGGEAGDRILELIGRISAPLIVTLHTVMPDPDDDQLRVMQRLVACASKLIVMSEHAAVLLQNVFGADADQIVLIPHGVPDRPFGRLGQFKSEFGFTGHRVLMTFGLLSAGKGIEIVIKALPEIVAGNPDVIYCIVGATHPNLLAREGE